MLIDKLWTPANPMGVEYIYREEDTREKTCLLIHGTAKHVGDLLQILPKGFQKLPEPAFEVCMPYHSSYLHY
jgi:hypothetical protein